MAYQVEIKGGYLEKMEDSNGDYVRLQYKDETESEEFGRLSDDSSLSGWSLYVWIKAIFLCLCLLLIIVAFIVWGAPYLIGKIVVPVLEWEMATFSRPLLGFLLFTSLALFPSIFLPTFPSMWLAGISFGYGYGFLLIMAGTSVGMSLPYFIGSLFREKIHKWIERWPKKAAVLRLAGEGSWLHQFRTVVLLRISPFPHIVLNYAILATSIRYSPYICGSLVGMVPEAFITIYSGILIRSLADASQDHRFLTPDQIFYNCLGICCAISSTIAITFYSKRALQSLQDQEEIV